MNVEDFVKENKDLKNISILIQRLKDNRFDKRDVIEIINRLCLKNKTQISFILNSFNIEESLPVVKIQGRSYYADERKREFRNKENAHDIILYDDYFKESG